MTRRRCVCGATVVAFLASRWYRPDERIVLAEVEKRLEYVCERGHVQSEQLGLFDAPAPVVARTE